MSPALFHSTYQNFLDDTQRSIQELARDFAQREIQPVVKTLELGDLETLKGLWGKLSEAGLTGLPFPEAYGGPEVDSLSYLLALEQIAKVSTSFAITLSVHTSVGGMPIQFFGTDTQKAKYLPDIISGQKVAAFGLTEPGSGSDAGSGMNRADKVEGGYRLNGTKIFITNALMAEVFIVTGRTDSSRKDDKGLSAFIVDRNTPGFQINKGDEKLGIVGSDWGELYFDNCFVPEENLLGVENQGFKIFMHSLDIGRISIGVISLGLAEACLEASLKYAQERKQFGQSISQFQAIQFKLSNMATKIEAARHLVYHAARLKDSGKPFAQEASMAKLFASEASNYCANEAVQIFGGYGYTKDFPVERYFRDAKCLEIVEGTSQIQRLIISKHLLRH
ncbi:MAG: acyl-CoA dehydrogenase family protein [Cyanobacteria bacterium]|nr:acyl-CoA dehydrogenase family protein [Cyanobacteriota bacterium]